MYSPTREELLPFISILLAQPVSETLTEYPLCAHITECADCIAYDNSSAFSLCQITNLFQIKSNYADWINVSDYSRSIFPSTEFPEYYL